jgi:hypothetical protein
MVFVADGSNCASKATEENMSSDKKSVKALARVFYGQLQNAGYTSNQILEASSELIELVTNNLKPVDEIIPNDVDETVRIAV